MSSRAPAPSDTRSGGQPTFVSDIAAIRERARRTMDDGAVTPSFGLDAGTVVRLLDEGGIASDDIGLRRPTLDEVFLGLTGQPIDSVGPDDDTADAA